MDRLMNADAMNDSGERDADPPIKMSGLPGLITATRRYIGEENGNSAEVIRRMSEDFAFVRGKDPGHPYNLPPEREENPPVQLGTNGFRPELVDDHNPARHYIAFVAMGYWLPHWL